MRSNLDVEALAANRNVGARNHWRSRIPYFKPTRYFTESRPMITEMQEGMREVGSICPGRTLERLHAMAETPRAKHIVLLAGVAILAHKYRCTNEVYVFTPGYGTDRSGANAALIPFRMQIREGMGFRHFLEEMKQLLMEDLQFGHYPLEKILNMPPDEVAGIPVTAMLLEEVQSYHPGRIVPEICFDFSISKGLALTLKYDAGKYDRLFIANLADTYFSLLHRLLEDTSRDIPGMPLAGAEEEAQVLESLYRCQVEVSSAAMTAPASFHQERLWFIDKFETGYLYPQAPVYHTIPLRMKWRGIVDQECLKAALQAVVGHYSILRTEVVNRDEALYQVVHEDRVIHWRADLTRNGEEETVLAIAVHHSIADRWTVKELARQIVTVYRELAAGKIWRPEPLPIDHLGFAWWQKTALQRLKPALLAYWRRQLGPSVKALDLPTDVPRAAIHIYKAASMPVTVPDTAGRKLLEYAAASGHSVDILLMAAFKILLYNYCQQEEIVIGTSIDIRCNGPLKGVPGPLSNLIVLRSRIDPDGSFEDLVRSLERTLAEGTAHSLMPFDELVEELAPEKDMSRTALFDVLFQYEEGPHLKWSLPGCTVEAEDGNLGYGKYDIHLLMGRQSETLEGVLVYNAEYYGDARISALIGHFYTLLDELLSRPMDQIAHAEMLSEGEKKQLSWQFDRRLVPYPEDQTVVSLFREQVKKRPDRIALRYGDEDVTYQLLDDRSSQIAAALRKRGVAADKIVGLLMDRSIDTVVGILSILKAGGAYLPIDIDYPEDRIKYLITDSQAILVLTSKKLPVGADTGGTTVFLEDLEAENEPGGDLLSANRPGDLCYVIYTSGTTGNPKGVMVEHRNVVRLFFNDEFAFKFGPDDVWTMFHSHCFDFSVWEIFGALLFGGRLVIIPRWVARDTKLYRQIVRSEGVTVMNQTPSAFYNFVFEELLHAGGQLTLRYVIFGGEKLSPGKLREWYERYPAVKLINMYGITETTVHVTYKLLGEEDIEGAVSNIGKPIPTLSAYVLDSRRKFVPVGVAGELYVGGAGVTRGYLHKEALTAERFIADPYRANERLYKTGDLACILPSGELEYLGRADDQVQVRGFRVEPGEIESILEQYPLISKAVVVLEEEADLGLIAYYVSHAEIPGNELRRFLSAKLPDHMVPNYYVALEAFPLTSNGKLDRKTLPAPRIRSSERFEPPADDVETKLTEIWSEILHIEQKAIGVHTDFFELGGHSLKAMILVNQILSAFNVSLLLKEIFQKRNIRDLAQLIREKDRSEVTAMTRAEQRPYYPLSPAQAAIYFFHEFDSGTLGYNMPRVVRLQGELDRDRVRNVFQELLKRHESLRTSFEIADDEPVQRIWDDAGLEMQYIEASESDVRGVIQGLIRRFDLAAAPLLRVAIIALHPLEHYLLVDSHHIVMDGTSWSVLTREFRELYIGREIPAPAWQYRDYIAWQHTGSRQRELSEQRKFWEERFSKEHVPLNLFTDHPRPEVKSNLAGDHTFRLSLEEVLALKALAEKENTTLFNILLSVFYLLLHKLASRNDIVIGVPVAGRDLSELQSIVGMFVNVLPMRYEIDDGGRYCDLLREVSSVALTCLANQAYEYQWLMDKMKLQREANRSALYDVMFIYQNFEEAVLEIPGLSVQPYPASQQVSEFDLSLTVYESNDQIQVSFGYQVALFKRETIDKYAGYFRKIISTVAGDPDIGLADIELISQEEQYRVVRGFNQTAAPWSSSADLIGLFEQKVAENPEALCLSDADTMMTYATVNRLANRLSAYLMQNGLAGQGIVGLLFYHTAMAVVSILAILKTGAAYLPLDPNTPAARLQMLLREAGVSTLLTDSSTGLSGISHVVVPEIINGLHGFGDANPGIGDRGNAIAYVIFTSGSTGKPKGVMQTHQTLINLVEYQVRNEPVPEAPKRVAQFGPYTFDVASQEIFYALLNGYSLHIVPEDVRYSPAELARFADRHGINVLYLPTAYLEHFASEAIQANASLASLERIIVAGEALKITQPVRRFFRHYGTLLENHYGPTETHICTTFLLTGDADQWPFLPSIGKPVANTSAYVLDAGGKPVPVGMTGELYIAGPGVARGYLNLPSITAERFIPNPFGDGHMYRTGDLARWRPDGCLEFEGRRDEQVKIRGYRIELGEIEKVLSDLPGIRQAAVVVKERAGEKRLAVFYTRETDIAPSALRSWAAERLPGYMVPDFYQPLEKMPLNKNGKLNKAALPEPQGPAEVEHIACNGETEERLARIWSEVLKMDGEKISATSSFFEIGGHSLNAITLINKVHRQFQVKLSLKDLFVKTTIRQLAGYLDLLSRMDQGGFANRRIAPAEERATYPLSYSQQRMYFLHQLSGGSLAYNLPEVIKIDGQLDVSRLREAFRQLIRRHESLRTVFPVVNEETVQRILPHVDFEIEIETLSGDDIGPLLHRFIRPFDLERGPLIRAGLITRAGDDRIEESVLIIDTHHIITDGLSNSILITELIALYRQEELPPLRLQYKDYSSWIRQPEQQEEIARHGKFWLNVFANDYQAPELPMDRGRTAIKDQRTAIVEFDLSHEELERLRAIASQEGATLFMVMLSVLNIFLSRITGQEDIVVGAPVAGRPNQDLEGIIGLFVNTLPLRNYPASRSRYRELLRQVKKNTIESFDHQLYPFETLVDHLKIPRELGRNPLFDVLYLYQHTGKRGETQSTEMDFHPLPTGHQVSPFSLTFAVKESAGEMRIMMEYAIARFSETTMMRFKHHFLALLRAVTGEEDPVIGRIELLGQEEGHRIRKLFNDTAFSYGEATTVIDLFEQRVRQHPENIALRMDDEEVTYRQLYHLSLQIAGYLKKSWDVRPGDFIGVLLGRERYLVPVIYGIAMAGAVYIPLEPDGPAERNNSIITGAGLRLLITRGRQDALQGIVVDLDDAEKEIAVTPPGTREKLDPRSLAYIIHTSGSTGRPKGVMIEHHSLVNRLAWVQRRYPLSEADVLMQKTSTAFDVSVWELFWWSIAGASLYLLKPGLQKEPRGIISAIERHKVTTLHFVPSMLGAFLSVVRDLPDLSPLRSLRQVFASGEALEPGHVAEFGGTLHAECGTRLINLYGPTEATIDVSFYECDLNDQHMQDRETIPIGRPIDNVRLYIVDRNDQLAPIGIAGELCIAGATLARGYLGQEQLTMEKFTVLSCVGERVYRTGDRARWLSDGNIEFLGRMDSQVKIRGYRIEPEEVQQALTKHQGVTAAVVLPYARPGGDLVLAAFVLAADGSAGPFALKKHLRSLLPDYMIPAYIILLDEIPVNASGKADRKALLELIRSEAGKSVVKAQPKTATEKTIASIWQDILGVEKIGLQDTFFDLGGHSLLLIKNNQKFEKCFGITLPLTVYFNHTLEQVALEIEGRIETRK